MFRGYVKPVRNISRPYRMLVLCAVYLCGFSLYSTKPSVCSDKPENNQINEVKQNHRQNSDTEQEYPENRPANLGTSPNETIEKLMGEADGRS